MVKLFIVVGFANWGKTYTLRGLFDRHTFFSTKSPIKLHGTDIRFTVINMSNDDVGIDKYDNNFFRVRAIHSKDNHNFLITLCPVLDEGKKDCREFFKKCVGKYSIHLITLGYDWSGSRSINRKLSNQIAAITNTTQQFYCPDIINQQVTAFNQRTNKIKNYIIYNAV